MPLKVLRSILWQVGVSWRKEYEIVTWKHLYRYNRNRNLYFTVETVVHCRSTTCITATEIPICINTIKIVTYIFNAEPVTCISAAKTSNWIIVPGTVTCMIAKERSTNITVMESTTCVAIEPQNLHNCNRRCHLHNCYRVSVT